MLLPAQDMQPDLEDSDGSDASPSDRLPGQQVSNGLPISNTFSYPRTRISPLLIRGIARMQRILRAALLPCTQMRTCDTVMSFCHL
jgi:hypothetical protein